MKKLPLGIQTFTKIINEGYVYVDKTQHIYNLLNGAGHYFLSRPRRFGKSLLLDTISEVFSGDKELFEGLFIYSSDYKFIKHPVIRLDMSRISSKTPEILEESISSYLKTYYASEGFDVEDSYPSDILVKLIMLLNKKYDQRVVVLIDEYDKPILDHIDDADAAEANRQIIRGFYGVLKSMDAYLRLTFITGVSKFSKTSIFSELNNMLDITMSRKYSDICGIPIESLNSIFASHIKALSTRDWLKKYDSIQDEILAWYDGYSWDGKSKVINPFSLISFFEQEKFERFWYASGTPKFLIDIIKRKPESFLAVKNIRMTEQLLDSFDIRNIELEPLLFQTGYLTVKEVVETFGSPIYILDMPNYEVRDAFGLQIVASLTESGDTRAKLAQMDIRDALRSGDLRKTLDLLRGLFASIPYNLHVDREAYYHSIFYAAMTMFGFDVDAEVSVSRGRVDAVLELGNIVYVFEFKYSKCPPDAGDAEKQKLFDETLNGAMAQINSRGYNAKYIGSGKTIYQAAFAFLGRDSIEMRVETI